LLLGSILPGIEGRKVAGYRGISPVTRDLGHEVA
jgi:hypothetical protein